jgi:hypothetical protein
MVSTLPGLAALGEAALPCRTPEAEGAVLLAGKGFALPKAEKARKAAKSKIRRCGRCV